MKHQLASISLFLLSNNDNDKNRLRYNVNTPVKRKVLKHSFVFKISVFRYLISLVLASTLEINK